MIHVTTDYTIFKKQHANRPINQGHVKRLAQSMVKYGFLPAYHIIVDGNMQVVDGQHRIEAAQMMGVPVHYVVQEEVSIEVNRELNGLSKKWSREDYLESYVQEGKVEYIKLKNYCEQNNLPLSSMIIVFSDSGNWSRNTLEFKSGNFLFDVTPSRSITLKILIAVGKTQPSAKVKYFPAACIKLVRIEGFDVDKLLSRFDKYPSKFYACHNTESTLQMLVDLHNYNTRQEHRIRID